MGLGPTIYRQWDTTGAPVALWDFNANLLDLSGNGYDLAGVVNYADGLVPGTQSLSLMHLTGASRTRVSRTEPALAITGALTIGVVFHMTPKDDPGLSSGNEFLFSYDSTWVTEANNALYSLKATVTNYELASIQESGPAPITEEIDVSPYQIMGQSRPTVLHYVRDATGRNVTLYFDGWPLGTVVFANSPTGGTSGTFAVGHQARGTTAGTSMSGRIGNMKVFDRELSAAEVEAEASFVSRIAKGNWP